MRVGVIGLGTIGQTHVDALRHLGVSHIYGADPAAVARARAEPFVVDCFDDHLEMLASVELDGVVVAAPPRTHREVALAAIDAGVGVLCEKPLALTIDDCEAMATAASKSTRPFLVGFCHRFQPQVRALKDTVQANTLGRLILINVAFTHGLSAQGREWITDPEQAGGGVLFDSGSHAIDLFRHLVGDVDDVRGFTTGDRPNVDDSSMVVLRSGGVLGSVSLSWRTPPWHGLIHVVGTNGQARVEYEGDRASLTMRAGDAAWRGVRTSHQSRFVLQMRHFLGCLRGDELPLSTAQDGLEATRAILQVYADQRTSGTRGSFSEPGHMSRTHAMSGSSEAAMVRRSPARKFR